MLTFYILYFYNFFICYYFILFIFFIIVFIFIRAYEEWKRITPNKSNEESDKRNQEFYIIIICRIEYSQHPYMENGKFFLTLQIIIIIIISTKMKIEEEDQPGYVSVWAYPRPSIKSTLLDFYCYSLLDSMPFLFYSFLFFLVLF